MPQRCVSRLRESKQQKEQAHEEQQVGEWADVVGAENTEQPAREQDQRSREEHAASERQTDRPGGMVRLPNGGRCEMSTEPRGQWAEMQNQRRRAGFRSDDSARA